MFSVIVVRYIIIAMREFYAERSRLEEMLSKERRGQINKRYGRYHLTHVGIVTIIYLTREPIAS